MVRAKTIECFSSMDHSCPARKNTRTRTVKKHSGIWLRSDSSRTKLLVRIQAWPYHWTWKKYTKTHLKISRKDKYLQQRRLALSVPWRYFFFLKQKNIWHWKFKTITWLPQWPVSCRLFCVPPVIKCHMTCIDLHAHFRQVMPKLHTLQFRFFFF